MFTILFAGMLTGLTATTIPQATPAFAETDNCKKNSDNNCNEIKDRGEKIKQEDNCRVKDNSGRGGDTGDNSGDGGAGDINDGNSNDFDCGNNTVDSNTGDNSFSEDFPQAPPSDETGKVIVTKVVSCIVPQDCPAFNADDFTLLATGDVKSSPNPFPGSGTGTEVIFGPGSYSITEPTVPLTGIFATFSSGCTGTINPGETKNCQVTNSIPGNGVP